MEKKPIKIEFAPGCFDNFEGSQEELQELIAQIHTMIESGELLEKSVPLDLDEEDELSEMVEELLGSTSTRFLQ